MAIEKVLATTNLASVVLFEGLRIRPMLHADDREQCDAGDDGADAPVP